MDKSISSPKYRRMLKWLKELRLEREMAIRDLADKLKRPSSYVTKIEQAERRLDVYEYVVYCIALGVEPGDGISIILGR